MINLILYPLLHTSLLRHLHNHLPLLPNDYTTPNCISTLHHLLLLPHLQVAMKQISFIISSLSLLLHLLLLHYPLIPHPLHHPHHHTHFLLLTITPYSNLNHHH